MARLEPVDARIRLRLDPEEVGVVASLAETLAARLADPDPEHDDDPVLQRFTPEVSRSDPDLDAELRGMLREDLLGGRVERLRDLAVLLRSDGPTGADAFDRLLDSDAAMRIVEALNDLRIALAATIGYEHLRRDDLGADDRQADAVRLMDALAWLQGGLIDFVAGEG